MNTIALDENMEIELNNGRKIFYRYMSDFDNPIFKLDGDKNKITIIDDKLYSVSSDDYDEPGSPLREDWQASEFFSKHTYDFFKSRFFVKEG